MNPTPASTEEEAALNSPISASNTYASELASREEDELGKVYDTPWLLPYHKIFISHSGKQKDFADQLCEDLETHAYYPFFDKRSDSLPKGKRFPALIFKAARECLLAIVIISEEFFTRSKWPMLELAAFVKAQETRKDLCILPVLLGLTVEDLIGNTAKWSESWTKWGEQDRRLTHNVIIEWEAAVRSLKSWNMILKSSYDGEVKLRKGIVEAILRTMPPDIRLDVLHVQGRERLCKEVCTMFDRCSPPTSGIWENATILGVHGIGGAGKSTLCMIITEYLRSEFLGRVCILELGMGAATVDLHRQMLRQLCRDDPDFLNKYINTEKEGLNRLKERLCRDRVFLAIDNVSDDMASIGIASSILKLKFHPNSKVLVTSRSDEVLCRSLGIPERSCIQCLSPTKAEALKILLEQVNLPYEVLDTQKIQVLHQAIELSYFKGYHPLALQLFAAQLGTDQSQWVGSKLDLEWTSDLEHPLFSKIETNYLRLPDQHTKDIFMDIALFTPEYLRGIDDIICWLTDTMSLDVDRIKQKLRILRVKSLLEIWKIEDEAFRIHDLYRVLAQRNASADSVSPRFIYHSGGRAGPKVMLDSGQSRTIQRAMFVDCEFEMLPLEACTQLKVLSIRRCARLRALCMQRLSCLVSLEVAGCALQSLDLSGLSNLRWLHISSCKDLMQLDASEVDHLQHVHISKCSKLTDLDFKNCSRVKAMSLLYNDKIRHVNLGKNCTLECLTLWFCESLNHLEISGVAYLAILKKRGCPQLLAMQGGDIMCRSDIRYLSLEQWGRLSPTFIRGLEISASLRMLDIWNSCMSRLPDLKCCLGLEELRLSDVNVLLELNDCELKLSDADVLLEEYEKIMRLRIEDVKPPISLEEVRIESCKNMVVKEIFWKVQGLSKLRQLSLQDIRVEWDWEIHRIVEDSKAQRKLNLLTQERNSERMLKNDICDMHRELSKDLRLQAKCGREMQEGICFQEEMQEEICVMGCLKKVIHCLQVILVGSWNLGHFESGQSIESQLSGLKQSIESKLSELPIAGAEQDPTVQNNLGYMFWNNMIETVEIKRSVCWIVQQIIHQILNNSDSFCDFVQQVLLESGRVPDHSDDIVARSYVEVLHESHLKEIDGQLLFLTSRNVSGIVNQPGFLKVWERMILQEVNARRSASTVLEIDAQVMPRLEKLLERINFFCIASAGEWRRKHQKRELAQFAWDWLGACRMYVSLEQLKGCLARQSEDRSELQSHVSEMQRLVVITDDILKLHMVRTLEGDISMSRSMSDSIGVSARCILDKCRRWFIISSPCRVWKVRNWLIEVASCLSKHLMLRDERSQNTQLPDNEVRLSTQDMELFQLELSRANPTCFRAWFPFIEEKAQVLIEEINQELLDTECLSGSLCESDAKKSLRMNELCQLTGSFLGQEALQFIGEVQKMKLSMKCQQSFLNLVIQLDMQLWQCRKFLGLSVSFAGKESQWMHAVEMYTTRSVQCGDAFVWPHIRFSLDWAETLMRQLTAQIKSLEFMCNYSAAQLESYEEEKRLFTASVAEYARNVVSRTSQLLRDELHFLLHTVQTYVRNEDLCSAELKGLWERAGLTLFHCVENLMACTIWYWLEIPLIQETFPQLLTDLRNVFKTPSSEAADDKRRLPLWNAVKLGTLKVGGDYTLKTENKSRSAYIVKEGCGRGRYMRCPSLAFVQMWDDVNSNQLLRLSFSECSGLRNAHISNCCLLRIHQPAPTPSRLKNTTPSMAQHSTSSA